MGMQKLIFDKGFTLTKDPYKPDLKEPMSFVNQNEFDAFMKAVNIFGEENIMIVDNISENVL